MYKLHLLQHPDWHRTGTSYCYFYIFEIIHHHSVISKINPSFLTVKEGSTSHPAPLSSGAREKTALLGARNRYALRLADHQRSTPWLCGMGPHGEKTKYLERQVIDGKSPYSLFRNLHIL